MARHFGHWLRCIFLIIANAHAILVPLLPTDLIDIALATTFFAVTIIVVFHLALDLGSTVSHNQRLRTKSMTLWEWIKSFINAENLLRTHRHRRMHRKCSHCCPRYITPRHKGKPARIARKNERSICRVCHCFSSIVNNSNDNDIKVHQNLLHIDSDSFITGIDSHASRCIDTNINHFVGPLKPTKRQRVKGINGWLQVKGEGAVRWRIEDDSGRMHTIFVRNALCAPDAPHCLLSPQHWSQQSNDHCPLKHGTWCGIFHDECILCWNQQKCKRTLTWDPRANTASFRAAGGAMRCRVFAATHDATQDIEQHEHVVFVANDDEGPHVIPDEDETTVSDNENSHQRTNDARDSPVQCKTSEKTKEENITDFFSAMPHEPIHRIEDDEETITAISPQAELLRWHCRLGHHSFNRLRLLAFLGVTPRRLAKVKLPKCAGCLCGSMTKRPWCTKARNRAKIHAVTIPGDCVSVDQLESPTPGFIATLKGTPTKRRYKAATVFVDHASRLSYVHLQQGLTSSETVDAKHAFEAHARTFGVRVKHCHADNGRFADNLFMQDVQKNGQTISFCGVNAHFQNGIAEKRIRDLQEATRKQLLHAKARWPEAVELNLWPCALRVANHLRNTSPDKEDGSSPIERFARTEVAPKLKDNHAFGCPVCALQNQLASGGRIKKWNPRARLGLNLGPSPRHASSVSLILNLQTGRVSPQCHVNYDDFFETVRPTANNPKTLSQWQKIAGFHANSNKITPVSEGAHSQPQLQSQTTSRSNDNDILFEPSNDDTCNQDPIEATTPETTQESTQGQSTTPLLPSLTSTRTRAMRRPERLIETACQAYHEIMHEDDYLLQDEMTDPIAFLAKSDPDTMYFDQAMHQPDRKQFIQAIIKEINDHIDRKHWELIPRSQVPDGTPVLDSVWSMKCKRDIKTQQVYKHKARLNVHGGQQEHAVNFFETCSPVVTWFSIRAMLMLAAINKWHTRQVDFVLACPQADIEFDMHMELPKGVETKHGNRKTHVLKLLKNLCGQKQAGRVWNQHLANGLTQIGFTQSKIDECVWCRNKTIFVFCVDDGVFAGPSQSEIDKAIKQSDQAGCDIEDKGAINDYLGVNFEYSPDGRIKLTQPHLIDQILSEVHISKRARTRQTPTLSTKTLQRDEHAPSFDQRFHCRRIVGKLNFLEKSTRPDVACAVHQCARFSEDPKQSHGDAVEHLCKYLAETRNQGIIVDPKRDKSFEVYADADFAGNWNKATASDDVSAAKSRTGYIIMLASCPIIWASKLQTQIALSTTEAEYIALSQSLRDTIPVMNLSQEHKEQHLPIISTVPLIHCKAFEDNSGALELARLPKLRPRTKHINLVYHHFRDHVRKGLIQILPIGTEDQIADIFTKPLPQNLFLKHRKKLLLWWRCHHVRKSFKTHAKIAHLKNHSQAILKSQLNEGVRQHQRYTDILHGYTNLHIQQMTSRITYFILHMKNSIPFSTNQITVQTVNGISILFSVT